MSRLRPVPFELVPFKPPAAATQLEGTARLVPDDQHQKPLALRIHYALRTKLTLAPEALRLPAAGPQPGRRDGLWEHTCLEAFVAIAGEQRYWELNLSPAGDWAVYRFSGYRDNAGDEPCAPQTPWGFTHDGASLSLDVHWPLPAALQQAVQAGQTLELGITAVLERQNGNLEYWALAHPAPTADFHQRDSFRLRL